jgi:hypothetical protein
MPSGSTIAVLIRRSSQSLGSGWTRPNPVRWPRSTQPPQTATAAASPITISGHECGWSLVGELVAAGLLDMTLLGREGEVGIMSWVGHHDRY